MSTPFKQHPTLDDLQEFAAEQRDLLSRLREARRRSYDLEAEGRRVDARIISANARRFKRVENVSDGRDLVLAAPKLRARARQLHAEAAEAEREAEEICRQIEESRAGRQMESFDFDLYLSDGVELPPHRRAMYEANARREGETDGRVAA